MKLNVGKTREQIAAERERRYLAAWPVAKQMEAHYEATLGRPEKMLRMAEDFERIRAELPYP